jgi:hypothetical protein
LSVILRERLLPGVGVSVDGVNDMHDGWGMRPVGAFRVPGLFGVAIGIVLTGIAVVNDVQMMGGVAQVTPILEEVREMLMVPLPRSTLKGLPEHVNVPVGSSLSGGVNVMVISGPVLLSPDIFDLLSIRFGCALVQASCQTAEQRGLDTKPGGMLMSRHFSTIGDILAT